MAALESIYSSASLTVLSVDNTRKYRQDLPSWVPDWEAPGDFSYNTRMDAMSMYDACAEYPVNPDTVSVHDRELILEGLDVDVVAECGPVMLSDSSETFHETMIKWLFLKRGFTAVTDTTNTDKILWRVFCADVILSHPGANDSGDLFRRMEDEDELMFVTWALTSRRSPFFDRKIPLREYISASAQLWMEIIDFETSISEAETKATAHYFFALFPDRATRKNVMDRVLRFLFLQTNHSDRRPIVSDEEDIKRLVGYATLDREYVYSLDWKEYVQQREVEGQSLDGVDEAQIMPQMLACEAQSERNCLKAWNEVPWGRVLEVLRQTLLNRLGSAASKIAQIPYDVQASLIDRSIVSATKSRRFCITGRGHVGTGPADLKMNDVLYLLKGARTPSILRSCGPKSQPNDYYMERRDPFVKSFSADGLTCHCSKCLMRAGLCSQCAEHECPPSYYKMIGDCYALDLMDSPSVNEHIRNPENHSWMGIRQL